MHLILDGRGALHAQLTRALKAAMQDGALAHGARLPPTRTLAGALDLSRNTVLAAYAQLRAEGLVEGRVGSGSYVASRPPVAHAARIDAVASAPQSAYAYRMRVHVDIEHQPGIVAPGRMQSFQHGAPDADPALTAAFARHLARASRHVPYGYPGTRGLHALREQVCDDLARRRGVLAMPDEVLIVAGTQQAITLSARVLIDEGDSVVIEEPHDTAIRTVLQVHGAVMVPVAVDGEGLCCDVLPSTSPKLVCVTPSHQFPTGVVMSPARRAALLDYAERHDAWIFEDDDDGESRDDSQPLAALRSPGSQQRVIYVGTFSKALFPELRLGYLIAPPRLQRDFLAAKWMDDFGSGAIDQAAVASFMADGGFGRHLRRSAQALRERRGALIEGLRRCGGGRLEVTDAHAGTHVVAWLPGCEESDVNALIADARLHGLGLHSIAPYYLHTPDRVGLLLDYGGLSLARIAEAVAVFAQSLDTVLPLPGASSSARREAESATRGAASGRRSPR